MIARERKRRLITATGFSSLTFPQDAKCLRIPRLKSDLETDARLRQHFPRPHTRHTKIRRTHIEQVNDLAILAESDEACVSIVASKNKRHLFVTGHSEYDPLTHKAKYDRDVNKGLHIHMPKNYYPDDDPTCEPSSAGVDTRINCIQTG